MEEDVKAIREKISKMNEEELNAYLKLRAHDNAVSVGDFIKYLETNFKLDDKVCYIDCVEGVKYDATPLKYDDLGNKMFKYVKDSKNDSMTRDKKMTKEQIDSFYPYVQDDDVIVI